MMKKAILLTVFVLINYGWLFAQYNFTTGYYDYAPQTFTESDDRGEDICKLPRFDMYATAGQYKMGTTDQGIRIGVYNTNGTLVNEITYSLSGYRETAVKILTDNNPYSGINYSVFVVCKTVNDISGAEGMLLLRYSFAKDDLKLVLRKSALYSQSGIYNPVDACVTENYDPGDNFNYLNVLCNKKEGTDSKLALYQFNDDLQINRSYLYNYTDKQRSTYNEIPVRLTYSKSTTAGIRYTFCISGGVFNSSMSKSTPLLINLNSYDFTPRWVKSGLMNYGRNIYNDILVLNWEWLSNRGEVLTCGVQSSAASSSLWNVSSIDLETGATIKSITYGDNSSYSEALRLTLTSNNKINVAGFKKTSVKEVKLITGLYPLDINSGIYYNPVTLPYESAIKDITFTDGGTKAIFAGQKKSGAINTAYLYLTDDFGNMNYQDFVSTTSSGFNAVADIDGDRFAATGYQFGSLQFWENNRFITRIYNRSVASKSAGAASAVQTQTQTQLLFQNSSNPFNSTTVIRYRIPASSANAILVINNAVGATIKSFTLTGAGNGTVTISAGELSAGIYNYTLIIDGKKTDSKKMILIK